MLAKTAADPACKILSLRRVNWLTLRHTYSSWAREKGVPGKVLAQLMGHAKVDTTLKVYAQVGDRQIRIVHHCSPTGERAS
jgi:integrase